MTRLPLRQRRSTLAIVDNALLVVAVVAAVVAFKLLGFVFGALWFVLKVAVLAALAFAVFRLLRNRVR